MTVLRFTKHAQARMQQRSLSASDCEFILNYGTEIGRDRIQLRDVDANHEIKLRSHVIARLERDIKVRSVEHGPTNITAHLEQIVVMKREIERIGKLRGALVVQVGESVVTCMHPNGRIRRRASHWR
jgi:hypothetical protein